MSSSIRIKVQLGEDVENNYSRNTIPVIKFIYIIDSPSNKTIDVLIRNLQQYINEQFLNNNTQIVQLTTYDGFILPKTDLCSVVLKDNDHILCIDMKKFVEENTSTIDFDNLWLEFKQHDASDDREKSIQIGLNTYSKLFIRMYGNLNLYGLYIFSIFELIKIASAKRQNNLIARLDSTQDVDQTTSIDWFMEAKWEYDSVSNKDLFIICSLKVGASDKINSNKLHICLDPSRMRIEKGDIIRLSGESNDGTTLTEQQLQRLKELAGKIPPPKRTGPQVNLKINENLKLTKHECEGESSIRMAYGNTNTVTTAQDMISRENGTMHQYFVITHIIFSKKPTILPEILQQKRSSPAEKPISVASLTVLYQTHDGAWRECNDVAIAPIAIRNEEPKWLTDSVINIEPNKLVSFSIRGSILTKGQPGRDNITRSRIHKSLPQPFKLKIVVTDNFGKESSLIVEQLNKPLELSTRESFIKNDRSNINELLAFIYVDDCDVDERIYIAVYLNKENVLVIKNPDNYSYYFDRNLLRTMEYNAKQNKTSEVHLTKQDSEYYDNKSKTFALFDPETYLVYAFRFEMATKTSKIEETVPLPLEKIQ